MDDSNALDQSGQDQTPAPPPSVPVAGKETEAAEIAQVKGLLEEIKQKSAGQQVERAEKVAGHEAIEDLVELRVPPEEETVEIPTDLADLGVQAVPPVIPPTVSDDDDQMVITLPLTEAEIEEGLHHKVWDSVRWLAEWCRKIIKMAHGKVKYASR